MKIAFLNILCSYWKPLVLFVLVAFMFFGFSHWRYTAGVNATNLAWSKKWSDRDAADSKAQAAAEARERNKEQQLLAAAIEEGKRADEDLAKAKANAADAQRAGDSLQRQLSKLQKQFAAQRETGKLATTAAVSQAKAEAVGVLAQLLSESDKRAGIYAAQADAAYINGSSCERTYDKLAATASH